MLFCTRFYQFCSPKSSLKCVTPITYGELDGNRHPYVGLMVAQDADGNPLWRCSGTLMSPTIFLTAGHCTEPPPPRWRFGLTPT